MSSSLAGRGCREPLEVSTQREAEAQPAAVRLEATVRGRVQGVGFRYFVVRHSRRLGLVGWVANEPDGSVRLVAEGSDDAIAELDRAIDVGPPGAVVEAVIRVRMPATGGFGSFGVRSGGHSGD
jgi:acylphosphatase